MICAVSIDLFRNAFVGFAKLGILLTILAGLECLKRGGGSHPDGTSESKAHKQGFCHVRRACAGHTYPRALCQTRSADARHS